ncbi:MAG: energy-coupling factor transporter transmembrane protein EcfT [Christensenellaceae bacterium]|nr:energy-coupling factor transporter transmembrane protein EcfT [Christensenellaceae bacterium]
MGGFLQYSPRESYMHNLDPRTKFVFFLVMALLTSIIRSGVALTFILVVFIVLWCACGIGEYLGILLSKLKALIIFISLVWLILGMFEINETGSAFLDIVVARQSWNFMGNTLSFSFELYDIYKCYVLSIRVYLMVASFYTVILTTNFSEIILGLNKWRMPNAVSFGIGLVFQIIPMIISEFFAIMEAQSSRGLEIEKCKAWQKMKNYVTVSFPLLFRVLAKGHAISLAMYYYKLNFKQSRTAYKAIKASGKDVTFALLTVISAAGAIVLNILFNIGA